MVRAVIRVPGYGEEGAPGPVSFGAGSSGRRGPMGKVPSLVFEMEDDDMSASNAHAEAADDGDMADIVQKLQALLEPWSEAEYMLLLHVRFAREEAAKRGYVNALPDLADTLRRLGYVVKIRTALGGGGGGACLRNLRHSFLTCAIQGPSGEMMEYVVDPRFREQFEIAHHTARYSKVLAALGPEVVATADRLNKVVDLLCTEMARAFSETNTPLPPWRQHAAMLSKWQPRRSEEVEVSVAMLNNEIGLRAPVDVVRGGRRKVAPLTGPATIAQRLAMLGVQQPSRVSPVAEGLEAASTDGSSSAGGSPHGGMRGSSRPQAGEDAEDGRSSESASLHLDTPGEEAEAGGLGMSGLEGVAPGLADDRQVHGERRLPLGKAQSEELALHGQSPPTMPGPASPKARAGNRNMHIWQGIKTAVATLPQRRNTWA